MDDATVIERWRLQRCAGCGRVSMGRSPYEHCPDTDRVETQQSFDVVPADLHQGAVAFSEEELHCLICAMAGDFPERFDPIRMDVLRKLAKAQRAIFGER